MEFYIRLILFAGNIKKEIFVKVLMGVLIAATYVGQAFAMANGLSAVFKHSDWLYLSKMIFIALICIVIRAFLMHENEVYSKKAACTVKAQIREVLLDKVMLLGPGYQSSHRSGNVQALITDGIESLEHFLVNYIPQLFVVLVSASFIVTYVWRLDAIVALVMLAGIAVAVFGPQIGMRFVNKHILGYWQSYAVLNAQFIDAIQGMTTLKVFNASRKKGDELAADAKKLYKKAVFETTISLFDSAIIMLAVTAGYAFSVAVGAWRVANGYMLLSSLFVVLFLVVECFRPVNELNNYWHSSFLGFSAAKGVFALLDATVEVAEQENPEMISASNHLVGVSFQNISFAYSEGKRTALRQVSFDIKPGETVAIVGKSGAGKSTVVNLLLRFFDPQEGNIFLGEKNLRDYSLEYLRSQIAVVFQETYLFYGTVEENLRLAKPEATMAELEKATRMADAHDFISQLQKGYQTIVGERGATLSGGERQRIAIARAILKDAPFLILDEATSSVDALSESAIQVALERLMQNRTTVIIAHRLSTVRKADRIFMLESSRLVECGTHDELVTKEGNYSQLVNAQHHVRESLNG
ncbi:MAG TPA: ABC transporter ATP-binding protein [Desulfosporosinus sp.]|nr:ABC transporter ATP-binding protein [Desulfosporosinus sp.]